MNAETSQAVANLINTFSDIIQKTQTMVVSEMPDFCQQIINRAIYLSSFYIILLLIGILVLILVGKKMTKIGKAKDKQASEKGRTSDDSFFYYLMTFFCCVFGVISTVAVINYTSSLIEVKTAPKVFVANYIKNNYIVPIINPSQEKK